MSRGHQVGTVVRQLKLELVLLRACLAELIDAFQRTGGAR
jgi:hypothetical protein